MENDKPKVLIIDNEIEICQLFKDFFDFIGYESFYETEGEKVINELENLDYDLMFVDLRLNGFSGIEILKKSKQVKPLSEVIIVTGFGSDETILETLLYGAAAYIQKPISFSGVKVQAEEALAKRNFNLKSQKIRDIISGDEQVLTKHFRDIILLDNLSDYLSLTIDIDILTDFILNGINSIIPGYYYSVLFLDNTADLSLFSTEKIPKTIGDSIYKEIVGYFEKISNSKIEKVCHVRVSAQEGYETDESSEEPRLDSIENIFVPLLIENRIQGVLGISGQKIENREYLNNILHIISKKVSGVLTNAALQRDTKLLALTDGLTGLLNRRAFHDRLRSEYERFRRYGSFLSIIVADFDNLKQINDNYGHPVGDEVIKKIGDILRETSRESDVLARYGGDEFVIVLPQTNSKNAYNMAERIRKRIEAHCFRINEQSIYATISAGVTTAPDLEINSSDDLLEAADRALYEAKRSGKNRVIVSEFFGTNSV